MRLVGLMPVRSEDWVLGISARVALRWCDSLVMLLHSCTDRSAEIALQIAREHDGRVWVFAKDDELWREMQHRQALLELARCADGPAATHIAIIDADEIMSANMLNVRAGTSMIRGIVEAMPPGHILQLPLYNLRGGLHQFHANGLWGQRWGSVAFADDLALHWGGDKFHSREPAGKHLNSWRPIGQGQGGIMHLWGASERRLVAKHHAYRIQEALRWPNKPHHEIEAMYSMATDGRPQFGDYPRDWVYSPVPDSWWEGYEDILPHLDIDAEPWQEKWCDEMLAKQGRARFAGLRV